MSYYYTWLYETLLFNEHAIRIKDFFNTQCNDRRNDDNDDEQFINMFKETVKGLLKRCFTCQQRKL